MDTNSLGEIQESADGLSTGDSYTESTPSAPAEKTYTASKVQEMIRHANKNVADKVRKETYEQHQGQLATQTQQPAVQEADLRKIIAEEFRSQQENLTQQQLKNWQEQEGFRIANEFMGKLNADKQKFPELESLVNKIPLAKIPHVVQLANDMENTSAVMHEVLSNPSKAIIIEQAYALSPETAKEELRKISQSIELNEKAKNAKLPNDPLSQLKTSTAGVGNGSSSTVSDWRKILNDRRQR